MVEVCDVRVEEMTMLKEEVDVKCSCSRMNKNRLGRRRIMQ